MRSDQKHSPKGNHMAWEVQQHTLADGWINTWTEENDQGEWVPTTYPTQEEAYFELAVSTAE
jgi:hypothetical protein